MISIRMKIGALSLALLGLPLAIPAPAATDIVVNSNQTNVVSRMTQEARVAPRAASGYVVLRDNFKSLSTCESYRKNYVRTYPYVLTSYCTVGKQSNGRHWLYVRYDSCPDR